MSLGKRKRNITAFFSKKTICHSKSSLKNREDVFQSNFSNETQEVKFDFENLRRNLNEKKPRFRINNVVITIILSQNMDRELILSGLPNSRAESKDVSTKTIGSSIIYNIIRSGISMGTSMLFESGKIILVGCVSEKSGIIEANRLVQDKLSVIFPGIEISSITVNNVVGDGILPYKIPLHILAKNLVKNNKGKCSYEPEIFPGIIFQMDEVKVTALIFASGKIVITGGKNTGDVKKGFELTMKYITEMPPVEMPSFEK
jgi:transcription initiation factor TFIID TATA-box-binding protein